MLNQGLRLVAELNLLEMNDHSVQCCAVNVSEYSERKLILLPIKICVVYDTPEASFHFVINHTWPFSSNNKKVMNFMSARLEVS